MRTDTHPTNRESSGHWERNLNLDLDIQLLSGQVRYIPKLEPWIVLDSLLLAHSPLVEETFGLPQSLMTC